MVSFRGKKKAWATPRSVSFRGLIQNFRRASSPLSNAESPPPGLSKRGSTWVNCNWRVQTTHVHVSSRCLAKVFFRPSISLGQPWAAFFCSFGYLLADHIVVRTYYFYHYITDTFVHRSSIVYDTKYLHTNSTTIKLDISFFENSSKFPFRLHVRSLLA